MNRPTVTAGRAPAKGAWLAYTHRISIPTLDVHAVDRYLWLAPMLGLDDGPPDFRLPVSPEAEVRADALIRAAAGRPAAGFARARHALGNQALARRGVRRGRAAADADGPGGGAGGVGGGAGTLPDGGRACPGTRDLSGQTTLSDLAALIRRAEVCVTNDSGSMHLTVALGRPVVSVFGPTDPVWIGPYRRTRAVVQSGAACSPCYLPRLRACPNGHACMTEVSGAMVMERVEEVLAAARQAAG